MLKELCVQKPQMIRSPQVLTVVNFAVKSSLWVFAVGMPSRLGILVSLIKQETYGRRQQSSLPQNSNLVWEVGRFSMLKSQLFH